MRLSLALSNLAVLWFLLFCGFDLLPVLTHFTLDFTSPNTGMTTNQLLCDALNFRELNLPLLRLSEPEARPVIVSSPSSSAHLDLHCESHPLLIGFFNDVG